MAAALQPYLAQKLVYFRQRGVGVDQQFQKHVGGFDPDMKSQCSRNGCSGGKLGQVRIEVFADASFVVKLSAVKTAPFRFEGCHDAVGF